MKAREIIGGILFVPSMFGLQLMWLSGAVLHLFTAYVALSLGGWLAAGAAFAFPVLGEIGLLFYVWKISGTFVNGYSFWVLTWLGFLILLIALMGLGGWIASTGED